MKSGIRVKKLLLFWGSLVFSMNVFAFGTGSFIHKKEYSKSLFSIVNTHFIGMMKRDSLIHTSVLVVSGSTGGIAAGLQCARMGVNTVIVEESPWLGGMLSAAGVTATDGNHDLPSGIWEEFRQALYQHYRTPKLNTGWVSNTLFEPHVADSIFKAWAGKLKNLQIQYGWYFDSALVNNGKIIGALFTNRKKEQLRVMADIVVDASDLGDVYASAGAGYDIGMEDAADSGEKEAPGKNNIIQDLTWAAILKDYGKALPENRLISSNSFDTAVLKEFNCATKEAPCPEGKPYDAGTQKVLDYGRLPNRKFMLNWPAHGNDYYQNGIPIKPIDRYAFYAPARKQTMAFVYYIQHILGYKHIGLDTTEFPTADHLALMPYHREGRRLKGIVRFTLPFMTQTFSQTQALYRTGIAVGDYPVDHHHGKNPQSPAIHFPGVNSFNIPLGALIPEKLEGMVVCEKGISVSNLANGSTRLQPCVLLTGQAAGVLAALSVKLGKQPRKVSVRGVQNELLNNKAFLLPYIDVLPGDPSFVAIQKTGATGILRGTGKKEGWANKTFFYPDSLCNGKLLVQDIKEWVGNQLALPEVGSFLTMKDMQNIFSALEKGGIMGNTKQISEQIRNTFLTRRQVALLIEKYIKPFDWEIDFSGKVISKN